MKSVFNNINKEGVFSLALIVVGVSYLFYVYKVNKAKKEFINSLPEIIKELNAIKDEDDDELNQAFNRYYIKPGWKKFAIQKFNIVLINRLSMIGLCSVVGNKEICREKVKSFR